MQIITSHPALSNKPARQALLRARARAMRFNPTPSEALLWYSIGGKRLGAAFKRQAVIGNAIVDFVARSASLVVEVDGDVYHATRKSADASRDRKLVRAGFTVLRLPASLVHHNLPGALSLIQKALAAAAR